MGPSKSLSILKDRLEFLKNKEVKHSYNLAEISALTFAINFIESSLKSNSSQNQNQGGKINENNYL